MRNGWIVKWNYFQLHDPRVLGRADSKILLRLRRGQKENFKNGPRRRREDHPHGAGGFGHKPGQQACAASNRGAVGTGK